MKPVPSRVVESYRIRYQLGSLLGNRELGIADAIDLHCHAQAGENPRSIARAATRAGMGGVVFKGLGGAHPAEILQQVQTETQQWAADEQVEPIQCLCGVQTDKGYGGLEIEHVRAQVELGARVIWFPVISSAQTLHRVGVPARQLAPGFSDEPVAGPVPWEVARRTGEYLLDDDGGTLRPVAREILRLAADHGVAVSFAHSSKPEMEALAEECTRLNYHQAFIDHPYGPQIGLEFEDLAPFAEAGISFNFTYDEISPLLGVDPQDMMNAIKAIGPAHFTLSSDGGNPLLPGAVDALGALVQYARAYGITDAEIRQMTVENPRRILGIG